MGSRRCIRKHSHNIPNILSENMRPTATIQGRPIEPVEAYDLASTAGQVG